MTDAIMEEKLEKLALSRRRPPSIYPNEDFTQEDSYRNAIFHYGEEDKKRGLFPYDDNSVQTITKFYEGKDILITGGTGFVGKVLIEKLLRSLPHGGRIFLLLRTRKGLTPNDRIKEMLNLPLFKLVMSDNPNAAQRLVAIEGDCACLGLGLSKADRQTIIDNVSIVFHCAATVNFNLPFSYAILVNTRATRDIVSLCKDLKKLDVFVYVSTAFSSATRNRTNIPEEVVYAGIDWITAIAAAENSRHGSNCDGLDLIFEKLQPFQGNTYTSSKLLSENVVEEECKGLPAIIVRPSVLIATYEDPFAGWVDNLYGPMSLWDGIGRGVIRFFFADQNLILDFLPIDFHTKTLICAAWHRGLGFRMRSDPERMDVVNNCTSGMVNLSFAWQNAHKQFVFDHAPHKYILRYPRLHITQSYWMAWLINMTSHLPLGVLVDTILKLRGRKPLLIDVYRRVFLAQTRYFAYFVTHHFKFDDKWQATLDARIPRQDKDRFSWETKYYKVAASVDNVAGVIKHVCKEKSVPLKETNTRIMHIVDWVHTALLVGFGLWILSWIISS